MVIRITSHMLEIVKEQIVKNLKKKKGGGSPFLMVFEQQKCQAIHRYVH